MSNFSSSYNFLSTSSEEYFFRNRDAAFETFRASTWQDGLSESQDGPEPS